MTRTFRLPRNEAIDCHKYPLPVFFDFENLCYYSQKAFLGTAAQSKLQVSTSLVEALQENPLAERSVWLLLHPGLSTPCSSGL